MDSKNQLPRGSPEDIIGLEIDAGQARMTLPEIMDAYAIDTMHVRAGQILSDEAVESLRLDFSQVGYFEEEILGVLLSIRAAALRQGVRPPESLVLQNLPPHLHQAFRSVRLEKFFDIQDVPVDAEA